SSLALLQTSTRSSHHARALKALGEIGYWRSAVAALSYLVVEAEVAESSAAAGRGLGVLEDHARHVEPSIHAMVWAAALHAVSKACEWQMCERLLVELGGRLEGNDDGEAAYALAGQAKRAIEHLLGDGVVPMHRRTPQSYTCVMQACERAKNFVAARRIFAMMLRDQDEGAGGTSGVSSASVGGSVLSETESSLRVG
ncbi:unnamed protein product, partial [Amoebophrya sp. A25]